MRTPASIAGHPIHPMLVPIPIGLWVFSLVCDIVFTVGGKNPDWATVALFTMGGGIVGALLAASGWLGGKLVYELGVAVTPASTPPR